MAKPLANEPASAGSPKRRRKWLWRSLSVLILIGVSAGALVTYRRYTDPEHIRASAESYLRQLVRGRVTVGSAGFSWLGGIRIFDVTVTPPVGAGSQATDRDDPIFSCREVRLTPNLLSSRFDRLTIKSLTAVEPSCLIIRRAEDGRTNLAGLFESLSSVAAESYAALPTVELRDARVEVVDRAGGPDRVVEDLRMTVRARPSRRDSRVYDIVWQGGGTRVAQGHSQVDLTTGQVKNVRGGLPWMSIEAVMIAVNARYDAAATWSDLLGLDGIVRARDYHLGGAGERERPRSVTVELNDASLSIPIDESEQPLAPEQRYLRFERVYGTAQLTAEGIDAEFTGDFHGSKCSVAAKITGGMGRSMTLDDVDFEAYITAERLGLPQAHAEAPPEQLRFIRRWRTISSFFNDFDPHGSIDLEMDVRKRAGADQPIAVDKVILRARGGDASYRLFPYRAHNVTGTVEFKPDGVFVKGVRGEYHGGVVTVDGWLSEPNNRAAAQFTVRGENLPIDAALCRAAPANYRRIHDLFQSQGTLDVSVALTRPAGTRDNPPRWRSETKVSFDDLAARYVAFPYALEHLSGTLTAGENRIQVTDVTGQAGEGLIQVDGMIGFDRQQLSDLEISLRGQGIAVDERLLSALPEALQRHAEPFRSGGHVDVETALTLDHHSGKVTHRSGVVLRNATLEHGAFPVRITNIDGRLVLTPTEIIVQEVTGHYHDGRISAEGKIDCTQPPRDTDLTIRCRNLLIDEAVRAAAPTKLQAALNTWRVEGPVAAEVSVRNDPADQSGTPTLSTVVWIDGATVRHDRFALPLEDVRAEISFDEIGIRAKGVEARYGAAEVRADFETRESDTVKKGTISFTAKGVALDRSLGEVMPDGMRAAWDRLALSGQVDINVDRLDYRRPATGGATVWLVEGRADLYDLDLSAVAGVRKTTGTIVVKGMLADQKGGTALEGVVDLSAMEIFGRRVTAVTSPWSYAQIAGGRGRFSLDSVQGEIYGGSLRGEVEVGLDTENTTYGLHTVVHQMNIEPFLNAGVSSRNGKEEQVDARGLADVRMHLSGRAGVPSSRRGGGRVEISEGDMYRLPIMLAILHVIDLSVPDDGAFDDAEADFYLMGNRLELQDIFLQGNILALKGYGSISLPDRGLDLHLVNITPHQWPRVRGLTDFMESAAHEIVELHVTGPLWRPEVTPRPLPGISDEFKRLFQKKKPKKMRPAEP